MALSPGTRLGSYEILAPLGAGGMGQVYRARDTKLDRDVAVKVLPEAVAADPESLSRFEREAKAVAALSHPNILAIHDFGRQDGVAYAVTELLEGDTLRGKIDAGPIPQKQAVSYAEQIAKGLAAAHEKGIVHRDLKPENVFVTKDGHVKVLDFGLAKRVETAAPEDQTAAPTGSAHTAPGTVMGTVGYMSPEQVRGLPVDHRSDIFSFGAILYELLSGKKAFKKDTASDTMAAIMRDEPAELSASGRAIPISLDHIVQHCLEKDRDNRFQSARDVLFALSQASGPTASGVKPSAARRRNPAALVAAGVLILGAFGWLFLRSSRATAPRSASGPKRIAVLPFENVGAAEDDYFADGVSDEIRTKLIALPGIQVIARGSSTPYKKTTKTPKEIARELDVEYLLTATVRWQKGSGGDRVHVTPELIAVSSEGAPTSKWQQPFDAALTDVFQVQSDVATKVAAALGVALAEGDARHLSEKPTQNLAAYDAFLKGEEASESLGGNDNNQLRQALVFYEQAVALDPSFALAWAQISRACTSLYFSTPRPELKERALQAATGAIELAPDRAEGYLAYGTYEDSVLHDPRRAIERFAEGRRRAPGDAELLTSIAVSEESLGRWQDAVDHLRDAERLDPRSLRTSIRLGFALLWLRRYPESLEAFARARALAPKNYDAIEYTAMVYLAQGDLTGARAVVAAAAKDVDQAALVASIATYWDLAWLLDDTQRGVLLRLTPAAFDDDRGIWALCLTQGFALQRDAAKVREYAEQARESFEAQVHDVPDESPPRLGLGLSLAYLGRKAEAMREGERGLAIQPIGRDAYSGPYNQHLLTRIDILVGEYEKALDNLEPLLKIPYYLSPAWLRIDPNFDPLRQNPRFQKLAADAK